LSKKARSPNDQHNSGTLPYAGMLHVRFGGVTKGYSPSFEQLTFWPGRTAEAARWSDLSGTDRHAKPWLNGLPRLIFVSDMSDSLSAVVPFDFLEKEIIEVVTSQKGTRHHWLWLTKRPDRMAQLSQSLADNGIDWPANLWAGTSITTQASTSRIKHLLRVGSDSTIRFLSVEPQWERIDLSPWMPQLDWIIHGGESGHDATPFEIEWALDLIRLCRKHGVPYFLKQLGTVVVRRSKRVFFGDHHAGDWSEWPADLRVREMPLEPAPVLVTTSKTTGKTKTKAELSAIAKRAWSTRRKKQKQHEAALKAWETRRRRASKRG
jgi:protein gp37